MKKLLSILLVLSVLLSLSTPSISAATAEREIDLLSGVTDMHTDLKTGIGFEIPEEWNVSTTNIRRGATGNGTSYTTRSIYITSSDYNLRFKIQQTGKNSSNFVVTADIEGIYTETYFLSEDGLLLLDDSDRPLIGEPVNVSGEPIDPSTAYYMQWKAGQSFLLSLAVDCNNK